MYIDKDEVRALIDAKDWSSIRQKASKWPVADITSLLNVLDKRERIMFYRALPRPLAAEVFAYLDFEEQNSLLRDLTDDEARHLLANLAPDDRTSLLEELPAEVTDRLFTLLSPEDLREARELLGYPEESVGRLMTPNYVFLRPEWTISQAIDEVRMKGKDSETINTVYVTDLSGRLIGTVDLRQIILGNPQDKVRGIMRAPAISISAFKDREEAAGLMEHYDLSAFPVVDSQGALIGIVTGDDVFEVAQEETTEDFHRGAGISPLRVSVKEARPSLLYKSRITWLLFLVGVYLVSSAIMSDFEDTIAKVVPLVFFLPVLIDSAGNAGSQSATLVVRALAMGDVSRQDWLRVIGRELGLSLALGATMAAAIYAAAAFQAGPAIAFVVGASMVIVVLMSCLVGISIPFALQRFGMDPATASSPFVTSFADITGVLIYFSIARWALGL